MAGTGTKRITELTEAAETQSGDYIAIDSTGRGTRKLPAGFMATAEDLSEEQTARQTADATLDGKITAEAQARLDADNAIDEQITALDEKTEADAALIQNPTKTLSGALCSFTDGADMPMVACTAEIVPKQSGSGTPSPSNVRPISGWESVSVNVTGVNVWDEEWESGGLNPSTGQTTSDSNRIRSKNPIKVNPSTSYYAYVGGMSSNDFRIYYYDVSNNFISVGSWQYSDTFTTPSNCYYIKFVRVNTNTYNNDISINYPSADTDYHAYNGTTTTTDLGRTVYGGTLDVVSGVLTVTHVLIDLGSLTWLAYNDKFDCVELPFEPLRKATGTPCPMVCSIYKTGTFGNSAPQGDKTIWLSDSESWVTLWVEDEDYTTPAEFKTAMSGVQLVYELATPQNIQLTPTEVKTLLGDNNVWADSGDVEITYRRDISIVLENLENALNGSNSLNTMMMSAPTETTAEEPTEDEAEDDMR